MRGRPAPYHVTALSPGDIRTTMSVTVTSAEAALEAARRLHGPFPPGTKMQASAEPLPALT